MEIQGDIDSVMKQILWDIHKNWPVKPELLEMLAYLKRFHPEKFSEYEASIAYVMGLFYKTKSPKNVMETAYSILSETIQKECGGKIFTPFQADAYKRIYEKLYYSFSAPTSSWKSHLFRELILETRGDIIIVVPTRSLIAEYLYKVQEIVDDDKSILVLPFIEDVNKKRTNKRIFIITPERWVELFKVINSLNIELFLFDEAQISEEILRGMQFDTFVRRVSKVCPSAKKVFAHPFISNPEAQLQKHSFDGDNADHERYKQLSVGKIYLTLDNWNYAYFTPHDRDILDITTPAESDIMTEIINENWTILIYISKASIYDRSFIEKFSKYIKVCPKRTDSKFTKYIDDLKDYIWADWNKSSDHYSLIVEMMEHWIAIHHWSMPLKARFIIEDFINSGHARICFSTATLLQGVNMPFNAVFVDNFKFSWKDEERELGLKNLIGRAWRSTWAWEWFEFGYVIINKKNKETFIERLNKNVSIDPVSKLDKDFSEVPEDLKDIFEAFKWDGFNDELYLPNNQILRISEQDINNDISYVLDKLLLEGIAIRWTDYQTLPKNDKDKIKKAFQKIYKAHLRRKILKDWEKAVLSVAIAMLLWKIQGRTFKEIVGLRMAYITNKDKQREIEKYQKTWIISVADAMDQKMAISLKFTQPAETLPSSQLRKYSLFPNESRLSDFQYDILVYDTYDYLDKVLTFSISNSLAAAFNIFFTKTWDIRALTMENYIRYWTNNPIEIMLLRYWFVFEDIEWIKDYIESINEDEIIFKNTIHFLPGERKMMIDRFI